MIWLRLAIAGVLPILAAQEPTPAAMGPGARTGPRFDVRDTLAALSQRSDALVALELDNMRVVRADPTVAGAAWLLLAFLANGSTMEIGPHRSEVRRLTKALLEMQDERGQFAREAVASSRSDQIVGTLALLVAFERSRLRTLHRPALIACEFAWAQERVEHELGSLTRAPDPAAPTNEDGLLTLLVPTLSKMWPDELELPEWLEASQLAGVRDQLRELGNDLLASRKFGRTRRGDAALHLGQLMLGEPHPPELTVARTWPASLTADPLHTVFAILAVSTDEKSLARQSKQIEGLLAARVKDGPSAGMWPAAGGFDETTTTAMLAFAIGVANGSPLLTRRK
ncbi:MAG TPA: hypothetical protein VF384_04600 [Planctomycetota bacterium]